MSFSEGKIELRANATLDLESTTKFLKFVSNFTENWGDGKKFVKSGNLELMIFYVLLIISINFQGRN